MKHVHEITGTGGCVTAPPTITVPNSSTGTKKQTDKTASCRTQQRSKTQCATTSCMYDYLATKCYDTSCQTNSNETETGSRLTDSVCNSKLSL